MLYGKISSDHTKTTVRSNPQDLERKKLSYSDILIEKKINSFLAETNIITEIHIESGIGKRLTVPVTIGLTGTVEQEVCRPKMYEKSGSGYFDDKIIKFTPLNSNHATKFIKKSISSSVISNSTTSYNSNLSSLSELDDGEDWIQLPIQYSNLPIEANIVFTNWCYNLKSGERTLLSTGRCKMFEKNCCFKSGREIIELCDKIDIMSDNSFNENGSDVKTIGSFSIENLREDKSRPEWLNRLTLSKLEDSKSYKPLTSERKDPRMELTIEFQNFDIPVVFSDIKYVPITLPTFDPCHSIMNYDPTFNEITYINTLSGTLEENPKLIYSSNLTPFDPDQIRAEQMEDPIEQKFRRLERMQHLSALDKELKPTLRMREELSRIMKKQFFEKMTAKERNMVWRYRWFMLNALVVGNQGMNNEIINFIKCVDWNNNAEIKEFEMILRILKENTNLASNPIPSTVSAPPLDIFIGKLQIIDCLELLSSNYRNKIVRDMAVERLKYVSDSELSVFMVQLVQSIKNEVPLIIGDSHVPLSANNFESGRTLSTAGADVVNVEDEEADLKGSHSIGRNSNDTISSSDYQIVDNEIEEKNTESVILDFIDDVLFKNKKIRKISLPDIPSKYIKFLVSRAVHNESLTNYFYWCLKVEVEEEKLKYSKSSFFNMQHVNMEISARAANENITNNKIFRSRGGIAGNEITSSQIAMFETKIHELTMKKFILQLYESQHGKSKLYELRRQIELVNKLHGFCYQIKVEHRKETTPRKLELLKSMLVEKSKRTVFGSKYESRKMILDETRHESMVEFPKIALPLDPTVIVNGTYPEESAVFKSSLNPLKVTFKTTTGGKYPIMYKIGDDLRQDQFVTQIISLMEKILEGENMDLKLRPYKILATGQVEGFIQFIPNNSLSHILAKYNNSILLYLQTFNPDPTSHLGVIPQVMDNYVRSCAGYCVVTYILGVGDRHLENLLLSKDGHFFHADFGYILGQDPKPFPPLMKLPIQIIEGMGGSEDINYKSFCQYCFITYITLRKNSSLILNLVQLMINTSIPALRTGVENSEAEKLELLWKVEEKFMLDMNDEEAVLHFQNLIDSSVNAVLPVVIDRLHNLAQYWRS